MAGSEAWLAWPGLALRPGCLGLFLKPGWLYLRIDWHGLGPAKGERGMDVGMDVKAENVPILQDLVPYWGRG